MCIQLSKLLHIQELGNISMVLNIKLPFDPQCSGARGELTEQRICCNKSFVINIYLSFSLPTLTNSAGSNSIKPWVFLWIARRVSSVILVFSWSRLLLSRVVTVGSKVVNFLTLSSKYGTGPPRGVRQKNFWQFLKVGKTFSRFPALEEHNCLL